MKIINSYMKNNLCYRYNLSGFSTNYKTFQKRGPIGIMLHSVGVPQPSAQVFIKSWNTSEYDRACVHAFIESDGDVYQTLPWNYRGWHCGSSANNTHLGIEMCEPSTIKYTTGSNFKDNNPTATKSHVLGTYRTAVELFATLCNQYNLNPLESGVIISHREGYLKGVASNHGDPEHLWKNYGLTMDQFRKDVNVKLNELKKSVTTQQRVKIVVDSLNIRKGPGVSYSIIGSIKDHGVYTIVDYSGDWGLLKSYSNKRDGWINLKYTMKL